MGAICGTRAPTKEPGRDRDADLPVVESRAMITRSFHQRPLRNPACPADWRRRRGPTLSGGEAAFRPVRPFRRCAAALQLVDCCLGHAVLDHAVAGAEVRPERDREMLAVPAGASIASCRFIFRTRRRKNCVIHWSRSPPGEPQANTARRRAAHGRRQRGARALAWRQRTDGSPPARTSGARAAGKSRSRNDRRDCSQPPEASRHHVADLVDDIKCTVSPRTPPKRPTVGSPAPMAPTASRWPSARRSFTTAPKPSTEPGMKSSEALSSKSACAARRCR